MSSYVDRPAQRLETAVTQAELALDDVHDKDLKHTLRDSTDQIDRVRLELIERGRGSL